MTEYNKIGRLTKYSCERASKNAGKQVSQNEVIYSVGVVTKGINGFEDEIFKTHINLARPSTQFFT